MRLASALACLAGGQLGHADRLHHARLAGQRGLRGLRRAQRGTEVAASHVEIDERAVRRDGRGITGHGLLQQLLDLTGIGAGRAQHRGEPDQRRLVVRVPVQKILIAFSCGDAVIFTQVQPGQVVDRGHVGGPQFERVLEALARSGQVLLEVQRCAPEVVGHRIVRLLHLEGLDGGERLVRFAPAQVVRDQGEIGLVVLRVGGGSRLELADRPLRLAGGEADEPEARAYRGVLGRERLRQLVVPRSRRRVAARKIRFPGEGEGARVLADLEELMHLAQRHIGLAHAQVRCREKPLCAQRVRLIEYRLAQVAFGFAQRSRIELRYSRERQARHVLGSRLQHLENGLPRGGEFLLSHEDQCLGIQHPGVARCRGFHRRHFGRGLFG